MTFDVFPYFWLFVVAGIGLMSLARLIHGLKTGVARSYRGAEFVRGEQTFEFWMFQIGNLMTVIVATFMFVFGLQFLTW